MNRRLSAIIAWPILLLPALVGSSAWGSPQQSMREGRRSFDEGEYEAAQAAFEQAAEAARTLGDPRRYDPAVAHYNLGSALARQGHFEDAAEAFSRALGTGDLGLQQRALFNRGNALVDQSVQPEQEGQLDEALNLVREAAFMYEQSMRLDPADVDPKLNYELAVKRLEELEEQQQQQQEQEQEQEQGEGDPEQDESESEREPGESDDSEQQDGESDSERSPPREPPDDGDSQPDETQPDGDSDESPPRESSGTPRESEPMTEEEAEMLLNAMREEESASRQRHRIQFGEPRPVEKDW